MTYHIEGWRAVATAALILGYFVLIIIATWRSR